jgi:hypothetical protein
MPSQNISDPVFQQHFIDALRAADDAGPVTLEIEPSLVVVLIGHIQLALRHPANRGPSAQQMAQFAHDAINMLVDRTGSEVLRTGLRAGFDERHDQVPDLATQRVRRTIVTLCGSTKFKTAYITANFRETLRGSMVFSVWLYSHADAVSYTPTEEEKRNLDLLHLDKIRQSDEILVLNVDDYIGESTRNEVTFARGLGKRVRWWKLPSAHALAHEGE